MHSAAGSGGAFALWFVIGVAWGYGLARLDVRAHVRAWQWRRAVRAAIGQGWCVGACAGGRAVVPLAEGAAYVDARELEWLADGVQLADYCRDRAQLVDEIALAYRHGALSVPSTLPRIDRIVRHQGRSYDYARNAVDQLEDAGAARQGATC